MRCVFVVWIEIFRLNRLVVGYVGESVSFGYFF